MSQIYSTANEALNNFVFATELFQQVKNYVKANGSVRPTSQK
jgi:hypothetical protein